MCQKGEAWNGCTLQSALKEIFDERLLEMDQPFFIALAAISGVLVIINLFGNTLVCVVILRNRNVRTPLNYLLFTLAVTDALIGLFSIPMSVFGFIPNETEGTAAMLLRKLLAKGNLIHPFSQVSTFSLAAIAFDRYQAVVHPLRVREKITKSRKNIFVYNNNLDPGDIHQYSVDFWARSGRCSSKVQDKSGIQRISTNTLIHFRSFRVRIYACCHDCSLSPSNKAVYEETKPSY